MASRSKAAGLAEDELLEPPMTEELVGDALGLTSADVNRTMKLLRDICSGTAAWSSGQRGDSPGETSSDLPSFPTSIPVLSPSQIADAAKGLELTKKPPGRRSGAHQNTEFISDDGPPVEKSLSETATLLA